MGNRETLEKIYAPIVEALEREIDSGVPPWRKTWKTTGKVVDLPVSGATGKAYRGANLWILSLAQGLAGYHSNEWYTFKGAMKAGHPVRKGEKGFHIFSSPFQVKKKDEDSEEEKVVGIAYRSFVVFNRSQCGEISEIPENVEEPDYEVSGESKILDYFRENHDMKIHIREQDQAFYLPSADSITMPTPKQFGDWESFDGVLLHEAAHWTKAEHRLDRNFPYAHEELIAELASVFGAYRKGIRCNFQNSASYLQGWLSAIKKDPKFLHSCFQDAGKAIDFLFPDLKEVYEQE